MATTARWVEAARRILESSGRPLSVRKILAIGQRDGVFGEAPDVGVLRQALASGGVPEVRRGVFLLGEEEAEAPEEPEATEAEDDEDDGLDFDDDDEDDGGRRRRRRRRVSDLVSGEPAAATSMDEAVENSA